MIIGPGISIGSGIKIDVSVPNIITSGLTLDLNGAIYSNLLEGIWQDQSGNGLEASLIGSPVHTDGPGGYFTFNGSTQRATVSGTPLNVTNYTKCIWFYLNATADNNLISYDDGNGTGHYMFFGGSNRMYNGHVSWSGFPTTYASSATFSNSTWYFVALSFNTTDGMTLYINGTLDSTYTAQKTAPASGNINLASFGTGNYLNGRIGRVLMYNRTLSSTEVTQNFQATKNNYGI